MFNRERKRENQHGQSRAMVLLAVALAACLAAGLVWYWHQKGSAAPPSPSQDEAVSGYTLSDATRTVLSNLKSPVEIRFYALLDSAYVPEPVKTLAAHAGEMIAAFEKESNGKVTVKQITTLSTAGVNAASQDGLKPLDLEKGDPSFLGIVVQGARKKEALPLQPEWEQAMEFDLARAIARVGTPEIESKPIVEDPKAAEQINADIKRIVPASASVEEGIRLLRESAMADFKAAAAETKKQVEAAQQRLSDAPEAEKPALQNQVRDVQLQQAEKLKEISSRLQSEIETLERNKSGK